MRHVFLILFFAFNAAAAEVTLIGKSGELVAISHEPNRPWELNERTCLVPLPVKDKDAKPKPLECGWVIMTTMLGATVKFAEEPDDLEKGRGVTAATGPPPPNAILLAEGARREVELFHWDEMFPFYRLLLTGSDKELTSGFFGN